MLIAKIFINERQIDEIHIRNIREVPRKKGYYEYVIEKPDLKGLSLKHKRDKGYKPLLAKVLDLISFSEEYYE